MSRKTVDLKMMLDFANNQLARTDELATKDFKMGVALMISMALHEAGRYGGWGYNYWTRQGWKEWCEAGCPTGEEKEKFYYGPGGWKDSYDRTYYMTEEKKK